CWPGDNCPRVLDQRLQGQTARPGSRSVHVDRGAGWPAGRAPAARTGVRRSILADRGYAFRGVVAVLGVVVVQVVVVVIVVVIVVVVVEVEILVVAEVFVIVVELVVVGVFVLRVLVCVVFSVLEDLPVGVFQVGGGPLFGLLVDRGGFLSGFVGFLVIAAGRRARGHRRAHRALSGRVRGPLGDGGLVGGLFSLALLRSPAPAAAGLGLAPVGRGRVDRIGVQQDPAPSAMRARRRERLDQPGSQPLAGQLHQSQRSPLRHLVAGAV